MKKNNDQTQATFGLAPTESEQLALEALESFVGHHESRQALAFATLTKLSHVHQLFTEDETDGHTGGFHSQIEKVADALLSSVDVVLARSA